MKPVTVFFGFLIGLGVLMAFAYRQRAARQERERTITELEKLAPVTPDFTTPEGAILCLEATYPKKDVEAAVACRDFETHAKLYLRERGGRSEKEQQQMLPGLANSFEKVYRKSGMITTPGWDKARSYFPERIPYGDGLVVVVEVTVGPDRSLFRQRILTSKTAAGWRVVTELVQTPDGWRVSPKT